MADGEAHQEPRVLRVFLDFAVIGSTAFGGGSATLVAMRRLCVDRRAWFSEAEYLDSFVLSRLSPGINILAQVILIGRRVAGWRGVAAAVAGMMLPAAAITVALSVGYRILSELPAAYGPLAAVSTVVAGFAVVLVVELARGLMRRATLVRDLVLLAVFSGAAVAGAPPVTVLLGAIALGVAFPSLVVPARTDEGGADGV